MRTKFLKVFASQRCLGETASEDIDTMYLMSRDITLRDLNLGLVDVYVLPYNLKSENDASRIRCGVLHISREKYEAQI